MHGFALRLTFLALLASAALAQQAPENTPAGDTVNEQQKTTPAKKLAPKKKIYHNADLASPETKPEADNPTNVVSGSAAAKAGDSSTPAAPAGGSSEKTNRREAEPSRSSVLDAPKDNAPDVIVVPAGTRIQVNILDGNVTVPVRVGWATPIPALTKVAVEISVPYYPVYGPYYPGSVPYYNNPYSAEVAQLTAVTLDGTSYDLQTDQIPVMAGSEATFTLLNDLTLKR
jgi:hypothetical protein